ncbi:putative oxidoreductase [Actinoplanes missouriensis 431]|uniref:Putative oxidoreductase n=1 Tax=Actinoplanes missouriensis (strain ATCC 14538 / DSM 43046 / CBS 188.64 / JCM 3121 / NBRC 102363 / NCIMB 12654 / NRRL B-3342 / UNCC 431) TaxID=512565 RepID=I0HCL3_ACTM4|nr:ferredoxin reductase [Actinoplanes missouriensis]BAL90750.1 putative oxidoreductase [Actinoplanes missouriensis 431]
MPVTQTLRNGAWRVVELLTTPVVPADYLDVIAPLRNPDVLRARIEAVRPETAKSVTLELRPGRNWQPHQPGQYVRLGVDVDGVRLWRAYSVSSAAGRPGGTFTVTVNAVADGVVSSYLLNHARRGMILTLDLPTGDFVLPARRPGKALFVTAGSGITPVMGMLRTAAHELPDAVVVHSARTEEDVVFGSELRDLHRQGKIRLIERHTGADGRLKPADLSELVPDLFERETWACGPGEMLDALTEHWADAGAEDRLHVERFRPTVLVAGDGGTVAFERSGISTEAPAGVTVLDAGEAAGQLMPSGCRMGICFKCVLPMREGIVRDVRDGSVTTVTELDEPVLIQTCISAAAGPCRLDA